MSLVLLHSAMLHKHSNRNSYYTTQEVRMPSFGMHNPQFCKACSNITSALHVYIHVTKCVHTWCHTCTFCRMVPGIAYMYTVLPFCISDSCCKDATRVKEERHKEESLNKARQAKRICESAEIEAQVNMVEWATKTMILVDLPRCLMMHWIQKMKLLTPRLI